MSLLDDDLYGDVDQFLESYGSDTPTLEQIRALQVRIHMLCLLQAPTCYRLWYGPHPRWACALLCCIESWEHGFTLLPASACVFVVLQAALAPVLLRRMKEDVEDLPEKEEVVIWVELTAEQRR